MPPVGLLAIIGLDQMTFNQFCPNDMSRAMKERMCVAASIPQRRYSPPSGLNSVFICANPCPIKSCPRVFVARESA